MNMKRDWDQRAEEDAFYYVASFRRDWDEGSFYEWGEHQAQAVIDRFLKQQGLDPSDKVALEIGCGAGRLSRALASRFKRVYAYDVSNKYVQIAKEKNGHLKNVIFLVNDGLSFPEVADESVDFAFSGWTMQHMPTRDVVAGNIREMVRVLRIGGLYKIDPMVRTHSLLKGLGMTLHLVARRVKAIVGTSRDLEASFTWVGATFRERELLNLLTGGGLTATVLLEDDGSGRFTREQSIKKWFCGRKEHL